MKYILIWYFQLLCNLLLSNLSRIWKKPLASAALGRMECGKVIQCDLHSQIFLVQQFSIKEQEKKQQKVSADSSSLIQGLPKLLMIFLKFKPLMHIGFVSYYGFIISLTLNYQWGEICKEENTSFSLL